MVPELETDNVRMRKSSSASRRALEEKRKRRKRSEMIEKIPVLTVSGANRNRNLIKLEVTKSPAQVPG